MDGEQVNEGPMPAEARLLKVTSLHVLLRMLHDLHQMDQILLPKASHLTSAYSDEADKGATTQASSRRVCQDSDPGQ